MNVGQAPELVPSRPIIEPYDEGAATAVGDDLRIVLIIDGIADNQAVGRTDGNTERIDSLDVYVEFIVSVIFPCNKGAACTIGDQAAIALKTYSGAYGNAVERPERVAE